MSDNPNLTTALRLAALGIPVFLCAPERFPFDEQGKKPRPGTMWKSGGATTDEHQIRSAFQRWPGSIVAFSPAPQGYLAMDLDRKPNKPDGVALLEQIARENGDDSRDWPTVQTASGGRHVLFRNPGDLADITSILPGVDIKCKGYIIAEGSAHLDGRCYSPLGDGYIVAIEHGAVPDMPAWLHDILRSASSKAATELPKRPATMREPSDITVARGDRERSVFDAAFSNEVESVRSAGEGQRNHTLNTAAFNLGQMVAAGWGTSSEVETALTEAATACGLRQPEIRNTIASGLRSGAKKPRELRDRDGYDLPPEVDGIDLSRLKPGPRLATVDGERVSEIDDDDLDDEVEAAAPIDDQLTRFGGVLGELVDWITDCGSTGNRVLSLSAALPLMGTLLGRRMATPTRGGGMLELYVISLFPSGGGKSDAARCVHRLMDALGLANQHRAQTKGFRSGAALAAHICRKPLSLLVVDEISDWFSTFLNAKSNHLLDIERELKVAWGTNFSSYMSDESMGRSGEAVNGPCFSIYGMTTPDGLFRVIKSREVMNGFVNRLTVINAGASGEQREPLENFRHPPERLLAGLRDMYAMGASGTGNLGAFVDKNAASDPEPFIVQWQDKQASDFYTEFEREFRDREQSEGDLGKIFSRTAFQYLKLATIRACGDFSPVTLEHMQWGAALARQSAELFKSELAGKMLDPLTAGELLQKIVQQFKSPTRRGVDLMAKYGYMTLPRQFLWQNLKHHISRHPGEFDSTLKAMELNGELKIEKNLITYRARRRSA